MAYFNATKRQLQQVSDYLTTFEEALPFTVKVVQSTPLGLASFDDELCDIEVTGDADLFKKTFAFTELKAIEAKDGYTKPEDFPEFAKAYEEKLQAEFAKKTNNGGKK